MLLLGGNFSVLSSMQYSVFEAVEERTLPFMIGMATYLTALSLSLSASLWVLCTPLLSPHTCPRTAPWQEPATPAPYGPWLRADA